MPEQRLSFDGVVNLPVGMGKRFLGNSNRFVDAVPGGFQVAFTGQLIARAFPVASANRGESPVKLYTGTVEITDCPCGVCRNGHRWFNGCIAPNRVNSPYRGVVGLPARAPSA